MVVFLIAVLMLNLSLSVLVCLGFRVAGTDAGQKGVINSSNV